ncbi:hypothetical protein D9756_007032 [Leucocoprinus leucothites]|uniref:Altered inheritance of mitochondria protein 9, mitochondrial n=1 Tax=Leucocoprinus leucothites TaxID=201217 RepID=A0A8H5D5G8_9AGAR|nr:hypothetical protein D9756_007032 [Leucoagaricus leucothites]
MFRIISKSKASKFHAFTTRVPGMSRTVSSTTETDKYFRFTSGRWLWNEREQNEVRYTPFDPRELIRVSCKATGARSCTLFTKLEEGSYNKAFRLTLDDSINVIARIPCPLAGPSYLVTASEVATLQFTREVLKLPVPRVITWSGAAQDRTNNVGTDFIIMEEAPGVPLVKRWTQLPTADDVRPALQGILDLERKLESLRFSRIGSLYFKEDVRPDLRDVPLLSGDVDDATLRLAERYCIGPLIDRQWWRGDRAHMRLDRGPWPDTLSYFTAAAKNEQILIAQQSQKPTHYRRKPTHDFPTHSKLLSMYIDAAPHFLPTDDDLCAPTLWHPDLHLNNTFASSSGPGEIQSIIDWQHATVLPFFMSMSVPPALIYEGDKIDIHQPIPQLPANFEELTPDDQAVCRLELRLAYRQKWYQFRVSGDSRRKRGCSLPHLESLMMLPTYVTRAWADGILDLREALDQVRANWTTIAGPGVPCPIEFGSEEMMEHKKQMEAFQRYKAVIALMNSRLQCGGDGLVLDKDYSTSQKMIADVEKLWDENITGSPFPYRDGEYSFFLS